jgi:hypothetical protein
MSPSWNNHPRSRDSRSRPEDTDAFELDESCAGIACAQRRRRTGRKSDKLGQRENGFIGRVPVGSMSHLQCMFLLEHITLMGSSPRENPRLARALAKTAGCTRLRALRCRKKIPLANSARCGYICIRSDLSGPHRRSIFRGLRQQRLTGRRSCFVLIFFCLGFFFPDSTRLLAAAATSAPK